MTTKVRKCDNCGKDYPTKIVKVYVFKKRSCPKCKIEMFSDNYKQIHKCRKCEFTVKFDDDRTLGSIGVAMKGVSRDKKVMRKMSLEGFEVEKMFVPKRRYCQRCRNMASIIKGMIAKEAKKAGIHKLSPEEAAEVIRREVMNKLREEHEKQVAERNKQMKEEIRVQETKDGKNVRITKQDKPVLLSTPFNTVKPKDEEKKSD